MKCTYLKMAWTSYVNIIQNLRVSITHISVLKRESIKNRAIDLSMMDASTPTPVYNDNQACVQWSSSCTSKNIKHVNLRENYVHESHQDGTVNIRHIPQSQRHFHQGNAWFGSLPPPPWLSDVLQINFPQVLSQCTLRNNCFWAYSSILLDFLSFRPHHRILFRGFPL